MQDQVLRQQLVELVRGKSAHLDTESVFGDVPDEDWGRKPAGAPHTLWQLLEHTRIALHDLLAFSTDKDYIAPKWPDEYWPDGNAPESPKATRQSFQALQQSITAMVALVENPETDLFAPIPWGDGQTILREALLAADHTSYHLGQAIFLRKQLKS